jgi:hypothetical protein
MEDQEQPFTLFLLETLISQSSELAQRWAEDTRKPTPDSGELSSDSRTRPAAITLEQLVRTLLGGVVAGTTEHDFVVRSGLTIGAEAHRHNTPFQLMLEELDFLVEILLQATEYAARTYSTQSAGHEGITIARRIVETSALLRLAATTDYTHAVEDRLRDAGRRCRTPLHIRRSPHYASPT